MGMIMHGYCLTMLSACDIADIVLYYKITFKKDIIQKTNKEITPPTAIQDNLHKDISSPKKPITKKVISTT